MPVSPSAVAWTVRFHGVPYLGQESLTVPGSDHVLRIILNPTD